MLKIVVEGEGCLFGGNDWRRCLISGLNPLWPSKTRHGLNQRINLELGIKQEDMRECRCKCVSVWFHSLITEYWKIDYWTCAMFFRSSGMNKEVRRIFLKGKKWLVWSAPEFDEWLWQWNDDDEGDFVFMDLTKDWDLELDFTPIDPRKWVTWSTREHYHRVVRWSCRSPSSSFAQSPLQRWLTWRTHAACSPPRIGNALAPGKME